MSNYRNLIHNPPVLTVKDNAREVVIGLVSCMCDNTHTWTFKKNSDGDFKIFTHGFAYSNFQTKYERYEIEWEADTGNWNEVIRMINSGTSVVEKLRSR